MRIFSIVKNGMGTIIEIEEKEKIGMTKVAIERTAKVGIGGTNLMEEIRLKGLMEKEKIVLLKNVKKLIPIPIIGCTTIRTQRSLEK